MHFYLSALVEEWRKIPWGNKGNDWKFVSGYQPHNKDLKQQRILIYGPTGSGKSSFINSVDSVLQGRVTARAAMDGIFWDSFTIENLQNPERKPRNILPFSFTDIMGIEKDTEKGARVEDIKLAMRGHIKDGYHFNQVSTISEDDHKYNKIPTLNDRVHVLVCVVSATTANILSDETVAKMREVRLAARDMRIPQLAILTKIDEACPEVKADIKNAYKSKRLKEKMEELNLALGVPLNCIFPVKSYHSEINTDDDIDTLILSALRRIIHSGEDFVNNLDKERNLQFVRGFQPHNDELKQQNILLYGPSGSGKSSFINSVDSVLQGRVTGRAAADAISQYCFTKEYSTYKIQKGSPGTFYPFSFTDIMGIEKDTEKGARVEDIKLAMRGHIKDGYNFNPFSTISEDDHKYNKTPTLSDRVHVLVCVVSAASTNILSAETVAKMREVRLAARDMRIPQLAILTKIDEACPEVKADIKNVYKSKRLKEKMEQLNVALGVPLKSIFPVKNYHSEIDTDDDIDTLILSALKQIIHFGEDFVNNL
ncbi:Interferon-induced protein 44 [Nibea albiflora]|uniref:Interferon-induced protein 44 n=1 Tax=Nibea albiflora TaxID=240163 RepID=A0ACB7EXS2_NIBAL|nr:Interferon-induced protein 44 [Nibea albiflora]